MDLEQQIAIISKSVILGASLILVILVIASIILRDRFPKLKTVLFVSLATTLVVPTLFLAISTVYLNLKSESKGPVHWHAEIEFWACGSELELRDPTGFLSNKIGTSTYHEHDDKHIHLEGVVVEKRDASLGKFMQVVDGSLSSSGIDVPLNIDKSTWITQGDKRDGDPQGDMSLDELESQFVKQTLKGPVANLKNGKQCGDNPAELQTFVYSFDASKNTYSQRKIENAAEYIIRDESSLGPPADCIIFEFDTPKDATDKLCEQYGIKDEKRCTEFGVKQFSTDICNIKEVNKPGAANG